MVGTRISEVKALKVDLRLTGLQHEQLKAHLLPEDGCEAAAIALCGRYQSDGHQVLTVRKIVPVSYHLCKTRTDQQLTWSAEEILPPLLEEAARHQQAIVKFHSHPNGYEHFSMTDDKSDHELFESVYGWLDDGLPHVSVIMLPGGKLFGRSFDPQLVATPLSLISVAGDDLHFWYAPHDEFAVPKYAQRNAQAFGAGTVQLLSKLSVAVVGCSGTGSPVIEQLARLGVGRLVLVDPDRAEHANLNRILNTFATDVAAGRYKVEVLANAIRRMGFGTKVEVHARNLFDPVAVKAVAGCDIVFGCVDSIDGRHLLNRLAVFYNQPYFDVGVKLQADGSGGVEQICGTVHYLQPGRSSLLSRGLYSLEALQAANLRRANPVAYADLRKEKYVIGAQESSPAVISVNMLFASFAVNEFLARIHYYRDDGNAKYATNRFSLTQMVAYYESDEGACSVLARHLGRGDVTPLLDLPELSAANERARKVAV